MVIELLMPHCTLFCSALWFSEWKSRVQRGFSAQGKWQERIKVLDRKPLQCHCPTQMQYRLTQDWSQSSVYSAQYWVQQSYSSVWKL